MPQFLLVLNAGSSSVKFSVFEMDGPLALRWRGQIEGFGASPVFEVSENGAPVISRPFETGGSESPHKAAFAALFDWLFGVIERNALVAAGHRVVHGGGVFTEPVVIDADMLARIDSFSPLAPLHQPHNVAGIRAVADLVPRLMQVACFDTAFHRTIPAEAYTLALPKALRDAGLRRYGFHGLSYENIVERLPEHLEPGQTKVIAAHLGNGASLCAIENGKSIETTMGFTALDGLVMGTRAGLLDPGVVLHLVQAYNLSARELETLLYKRCGLLGLSGETNDMRALLDSGAPEARLAVDCFVYRAAREIGALTAALGGLDALVFTAGIGERSAEIRRRICARLGWLGVELDSGANAAHRPRISAPDSRVAVLIIPADEEHIIAQHTLKFTR
ncbi:MAG: acetate/propionate family kinase [Rhodomicrobiaceae bacterium]